MDGLVESAGEPTEDYYLALGLGSSSGRPSGVGTCSTYPVRPRLKFGEAGDAFHQVSRVLVFIPNDGNALLHTQHSPRNMPEMLETYLRQVIFFHVVPYGIEVSLD